MFASFMLTVPPFVRLLLAIVITVGITVTLVRALHPQLVEMSGQDEVAKREHKKRQEAGEDDLPPLPPESYNLAARVLGLTGTGFVFLLAFTLGNFWGTASDARAATQAEVADWTRAAAAAKALDSGQPVLDALETYKASVVGPQWLLMQEGEAQRVSELQVSDAQALVGAILEIEATSQDTPEWGQLTAAVDDMLDQSRERIDAVPNPSAPGVITLIFLLAITNLAMVAIFQPARLGPNLFLMSVMAGITAVMLFVLVEASNPYLGAVAVTPVGF